MLLDIHKRLGYFPEILLLHGNTHSQNSVFTSHLFLWVVADIVKRRLIIGQHLEKRVSGEERKEGLRIKSNSLVETLKK